MNNLEIYEKCRAVPPEALKTIVGGRLKGMTDINPMWRIKKLTELFGPVGIGWWYAPKRFWAEPGANGEVIAFSEIELFYILDGKVSQPIPGIGGSKLISKETSGLFTNDECYKMATTDALSVACKALGIGADIYWDKDRDKYSNNSLLCPKCGKKIAVIKSNDGQILNPEEVLEKLGQCYNCWKSEQQQKKQGHEGKVKHGDN